jgi:DNA-binding response OmpR family regulator
MPHRIAIVEDDADQRSMLARSLSSRGFDVDAYADRRRALDAVRAGRVPELAVLDVNLSGDDPEDRDGFDLCRELQQLPGCGDLPVIFLTHLQDHEDRLEGLQLAIAWLTKPVDLDVLGAQIRTLLRWSQRLRAPADDGRLEVGDLCVDRGSSRVSWKGRSVEPTYSEFQILERLAQTPGKTVTYQDLEDALGTNVANNTISTHVKNLRDKLEGVDPGFDRKIIAAVAKVGYRWDAPPA